MKRSDVLCPTPSLMPLMFPSKDAGCSGVPDGPCGSSRLVLDLTAICFSSSLRDLNCILEKAVTDEMGPVSLKNCRVLVEESIKF